MLCDIGDDTTSTGGSWYLGVVAGLIPITAVVALDPQGWFPFSVAKWWSTLTVALLAAALAAAQRPMPSAAPLPRLERATIALMVMLLVVVGLSSLVALDGWYAWVGTPIRHLGLLAWFVFALMFAVGRRVGADDEASGVAIRGTLVAGLLLGLYCMLELIAGPPVEFVSNSSRLGGTFGSAAYLGAACCLLLPVALGASIDGAEARSWRIVGALASAGVAVAVIGSGSRSALVGLAVSGVVVTGCALFGRAVPDRNARSGPVMSSGAAVTVVLSGGLAVVAATWAGVFERTAGWTSRLDEWRIALRAIVAHPVTGVGPEGYRLVVGRFIDADYVRRYGESTGIDRAHSGVLDVTITSGIVAGAIYLALLGVVCWSAVRLIRRGYNTASARCIGLGGAVIGYAVQQQLLFPIAELDPVFWLLAGIVVVRARPFSGVHDNVLADEPTRRRRQAKIGTVAAALLALAVTLSAVSGVRAVAADRLARDAIRASDVDVAIKRAEAATRRAPHDIRHRLLLARSHERERSLTGIDRALEGVDAALDISPLEPTARFERARLLSLRAAITGDGTDRLAAAQAWDDEFERSPYCARCHLEAGLAALERGDTAAARTSLATAADLGNERALVIIDQVPQD